MCSSDLRASNAPLKSVSSFIAKSQGVTYNPRDHVTRVVHRMPYGGGAADAFLDFTPPEAAALRAAHPEPFALVTPGIRPAGSPRGDQARVMTPAAAIAAGASQLVIGRPITAAADPAGAFARCCAELTV